MIYEYLVCICMFVVMIAALVGYKFPKLSVACAKIVIASGGVVIIGSFIYAIVKVLA